MSTKCRVNCSSQVVVCSFFRAGGIEEFSTEALGKMAMVVRNLHFLEIRHYTKRIKILIFTCQTTKPKIILKSYYGRKSISN